MTANGNVERYPILRYFAYAHLPADLQVVSRPFGQLAEDLTAILPYNPELEAKDAAVRAALD